MVVRPCVREDAAAAQALRGLAFGGPREADPSWVDSPGFTAAVAELGGAVVGFTRVWAFRQFFGGRAVPCGGVASVAVAPHARGRGVASALLDDALVGMREAGQAVSALFPYVKRPYRARGWEHAGALERVRVPLAELRVPRVDVEVRPGTAADLAGAQDAYLRTARDIDGMFDRTTPGFTVERALAEDVFTVAVDGSGVRGYLVARRPDGSTVDVLDLVADDVDTAHALLGQVASWAGYTPEAGLRVLDPALLDLVLPSSVTRGAHVETWMLRVVDLPAAVAARGWPHAPDLAVDVEVVDEHAPWQAGRWRLTAEGGQVRAERGGEGSVRLLARALGPWFAGAASSGQLRRSGLLDGDAEAARALDRLVGGPGLPRLADAF
ncbi:hypothetical protein BJP25_02805 [Actinokineospora bangkokensis]|uniref:N-acetyltransferase domain-containing protein n=1 Tax=Actinokineospora bangkokensis TaxID=1193682 RepID=A0A1Q9LE35_9PSEU|nr:hypothetical protein BJP25_02805 [Actinokineospora bangkokensis]